MQDIRIALVGMTPAAEGLRYNLPRLLERIEEASRHGAGLVVFPEGILTGYELDRKEEVAIRFDGPELATVQDHAARLGLCASVGYLERSENSYYVSQALVGREVRFNYRKCHQTAWEKQHCLPGGVLEPHAVGGLLLGTLICYDSAFPRASETLVRKGAELIFSPTCHAYDSQELTAISRGEAFRRRRAHVIRYWGARAYDLTVFTCYVDNAGETRQSGWFPGYAAVFGPDGDLVAENATGAPGILYADLQAAALFGARKRHVGHFHTLGDVRPELYS